jgi:BirA family biotin operon repressor/biotin-[acetyl-CoA-carboxylase] ligase
MDAGRLERELESPVVAFGETTNTTDTLRSRGWEGAPHGTFAVAEALTSAVGRSGSEWSAPPGGVWSSTLLRPPFGPAHVGRLTFACGLAVAEAVESFGVDAGLKWPNDVVVVRNGAEHKLAGVLTEAVVDDVPVAGKPVDEALDDPGELQFAVVGVGVNADLDPGELTTDRRTTTMRAEVGEVDPTEVAVALHERLLARAADAETAEGFATVLSAWRERSTTLGERVGVERRDGATFEGVASALRADGALVVETADGEKTVTEGEVERLRRT